MVWPRLNLDLTSKTLNLSLFRFIKWSRFQNHGVWLFVGMTICECFEVCGMVFVGRICLYYFNILYSKIEYEMWGILLNWKLKINKVAFSTVFAKCSPLDSLFLMIPKVIEEFICKFQVQRFLYFNTLKLKVKFLLIRGEWWSHGRLICYYFANSPIQKLFYWVLLRSPIEVNVTSF